VNYTLPVVVLSAALDASALFYEQAMGGEAAVSGMVALLAAVRNISFSHPLLPPLDPPLPLLDSRFTPCLPQADALARAGVDGTHVALDKQIVYTLFDGEQWGYIGSRRWLHDIQGFKCQQVG
jgi:nicastrin